MMFNTLIKYIRVFLLLIGGMFLLAITQPSLVQAQQDTTKKVAHEAEGEDHEGEVHLRIKPGNKDAIFNGSDAISYKVSVKNAYKVAQEGKLSYVVSSDKGKFLFEDSVAVKIGRNGSKSYRLHVPHQQPGFYKISFRFNFSYYDDTVGKVFGVDPLQIKSEVHKPADFDAFWSKTKEELAKVDPQYRIIERKDLFTKEKKVYLIEMRSLDNLLIRGWLTVPKGNGKYPVLYRLPGYTIEMKPDFDKEDFAVFTINVRGNGNSRDVITADYKGYNTLNIQDKDKYIYRGVYMDCLRGLDFLASHADLGLKTDKIVAEGGSQGGGLGIMLAGLDKRIKLCTVQVPLYVDMHNAYEVAESYPETTWPIRVFKQYIKDHKDFTKEQLLGVWDYYDPQNFAPMVQCPVLVGIGLLDEFCPPACTFAMYNKLNTTKKEIYIVPDKAHEVTFTYFMFQYNWLKEYFRMP